MQKSTFRGAVVGVSVGLVAFGSVASAAFLASGELNAQVTAGTVQVMDVTAVAQDELFPGYMSDVAITFTNPNEVQTRVTGVTFKSFTGASQLTPYLVAEQTLAVGGVNPTTGALRPLVLEPGASQTVTVPNAVGLRTAAPNSLAGAALQGSKAVAVYSVTYSASPGTETAKLEGGSGAVAP